MLLQWTVHGYFGSKGYTNTQLYLYIHYTYMYCKCATSWSGVLVINRNVHCSVLWNVYPWMRIHECILVTWTSNMDNPHCDSGDDQEHILLYIKHNQSLHLLLIPRLLDLDQTYCDSHWNGSTTIFNTWYIWGIKEHNAISLDKLNILSLVVNNYYPWEKTLSKTQIME